MELNGSFQGSRRACRAGQYQPSPYSSRLQVQLQGAADQDLLGPQPHPLASPGLMPSPTFPSRLFASSPFLPTSHQPQGRCPIHPGTAVQGRYRECCKVRTCHIVRLFHTCNLKGQEAEAPATSPWPKVAWGALSIGGVGRVGTASSPSPCSTWISLPTSSHSQRQTCSYRQPPFGEDIPKVFGMC